MRRAAKKKKIRICHRQQRKSRRAHRQEATRCRDSTPKSKRAIKAAHSHSLKNLFHSCLSVCLTGAAHCNPIFFFFFLDEIPGQHFAFITLLLPFFFCFAAFQNAQLFVSWEQMAMDATTGANNAASCALPRCTAARTTRKKRPFAPQGILHFGKSSFALSWRLDVQLGFRNGYGAILDRVARGVGN